MPSITFRGKEVELVTSVDTLDLDAAEILETEIGVDIRDFGSLPKIRMFKALALISARAAGFTDVTMAEVGRLKLDVLISAFAAPVEPAATAAPPVEFTGTMRIEAVADDGDGAEVLSPTNAGSGEQPALPAA